MYWLRSLLFFIGVAASQYAWSAHLYKITKGQKIGYVFASAHTPFSGQEQPSNSVKDAIRASTVIAFESSGPLSPAEIADHKLDFKGSQAAFSSLSDRSKECLTRANRNELIPTTNRVVSIELGHPYLMAYRLLRVISGTIHINGEPIPELSLDEVIRDLGRSHSIALTAFELNREKAERVKSHPALNEFIDAICETATNPVRAQEFRKLLVATAIAYKIGNLNEIARLTEVLYGDFLRGGSDYVKQLLHERNENFARQIVAFHERSRGIPFCVFGAAHLGGQKGVLKILEGWGYKIELISN
jgi:hypothetical protein